MPHRPNLANPRPPPEPDLGGDRDRALLLVGFVVALRRSELAALTTEHVAEHPNGLVISIPRSKANQTGSTAELVVLPRSGSPSRCPVRALQQWLNLAGITNGPLLQGVTKASRPSGRALHPESVNNLVQAAVARAGIDPTLYSAHSLRAGFVTWAHLRGATDRAIAHQTRHRSLATLGQYVRIHEARTDNAATQQEVPFPGVPMGTSPAVCRLDVRPIALCGCAAPPRTGRSGRPGR